MVHIELAVYLGLGVNRIARLIVELVGRLYERRLTWFANVTDDEGPS